MMRIPCHVLLILVLAIICSQAGVVKRQPGEKTAELAMDFFEEFNNLFGYDWWGTGAADKEPAQVVVSQELRDNDKYQKDDDLAALIEDVLLTETPPTKEVHNEEYHLPSPSHPLPYPQPPARFLHPWQNQAPVQDQFPHLQPHQVLYKPYPTTQDNQPILPLTPHHPPYHPPPHPYYYNPNNYMFAPQDMPPPTQSKDADNDFQPEARTYNFDGLSSDRVMKTSSEPLTPPSHGQNHFFLPPPPPPSFYNPPPHNFAPPRVFLDSSLDTFMSQAPIGPQQARARSHEVLLSERSHGATKDEEITFQTMLEEKLAAEAQLNDNAANDEDLDEEAVHNLEAGRPSPYFFPPEARMNDDDDRNGYPQEDDNLDQDATSPVLTDQGHLEYLSLSSSNKSPFAEDSSVDLLKEFLDAEEETEDDEDDTISELNETTMCQTPEGLIGSCSTPTECSMVSGLPSGICSVPSVAGDLSCCLYSAHCGQQSAQLVTYIHNQDYPYPTSTLPSCPISIALLPDICQVRLDFLHLSLSPPVSESCDPTNSLTLSTTPGGSVPQHPLCDYIAGSADPLTPDIPHLYAHYNLSHSPSPHLLHQLNLNIVVNNFPSTWNIRVAQIRCDLNSPILAPLMAMSTCSQWHTSASGIMDSVNLLLGSTKQFKACIKPDPAACAVKYHFYSVVCNMEDQVQIIGSDVAMCGESTEEWEVVVPVGEVMGVVVSPGKKQDGGASSYTVGYTLLYDCTGLLGQN